MAPRSPPSLSEEVETLDRARTALSKGDVSSALATLDEYDRVLHGTHLVEEATLLRVDTLSRSGRRDAAARIAKNFIETHPGSPLSERVRSLVDTGVTQKIVDGGGPR